MNIRMAALMIAAGLSAAALPGCEGTTQQGTLYRVQIDRELETYLPAGVGAVHRAALAVLRDDLGYTVEDEAVDATEGLIEARTAQEHRVRVETFKHGDDVTRIEVYAGTPRSEMRAREILGRIEKRLGGGAGK